MECTLLHHDYKLDTSLVGGYVGNLQQIRCVRLVNY